LVSEGGHFIFQILYVAKIFNQYFLKATFVDGYKIAHRFGFERVFCSRSDIECYWAVVDAVSGKQGSLHLRDIVGNLFYVERGMASNYNEDFVLVLVQVEKRQFALITDRLEVFAQERLRKDNRVLLYHIKAHFSV